MAALDLMTESAASLLEAQMTRFARLLHDNAFPVGISEITDALTALGAIDATDIRQVRHTLRTLFASTKRDWRRFDEIFDAFWLGRARKRRSVIKQKGGAPSGPAQERGAGAGKAGTLADYFDWGANANDNEAIAAGRTAGASSIESLAKTDFRQVTDPEQLERLHALAEAWAARIRYRLSRRRRITRRGTRPVLRRTFQRSVSTGGMPLKLYRSRRKPKPFSIVIFVDVSGSMDLYSLFFTRFVHALTAHFARTEAFIFHTQLVQITSTLKTADPMKLMEKMALISQGWSGGTRIGEALAAFNDRYASAIMNSRTLAIIVSDGFDTGPAGQLAAELARLKRRTKRLVWLNPLLGRASYEPRAAAMAAALPYLDLFAPAHNLESLAALEEELARL
ncbi:MAG: VWA domain-containing protein [Rhodomicrobiaceae bacterium]